MAVGTKGVAPQLGVKMGGETLEGVRSFKFLSICFSKIGSSGGEVNMRVGERLNTFLTIKKN